MRKHNKKFNEFGPKKIHEQKTKKTFTTAQFH